MYLITLRPFHCDELFYIIAYERRLKITISLNIHAVNSEKFWEKNVKLFWDDKLERLMICTSDLGIMQFFSAKVNNVAPKEAYFCSYL
jgi:hypothetical protein